jgi:hypothetical protein
MVSGIYTPPLFNLQEVQGVRGLVGPIGEASSGFRSSITPQGRKNRGWAKTSVNKWKPRNYKKYLAMSMWYL